MSCELRAASKEKYFFGLPCLDQIEALIDKAENHSYRNTEIADIQSEE